LFDVVGAFFAVPFPLVPSCIQDVISDDHLKAFRGSMGMAAKDFAHHQRDEKQHKHRPLQAKGGLVFSGLTCPPMFLADYWTSESVDDIVPMEYVSNPQKVVRSAALQALAAWYPDQEVVQALVGGGVPSQDRREDGVAMLGTNHKAALDNAAFVNKMYNDELAAERMSKFGIAHSPCAFGGGTKYAPSGCVDKNLRDGTVDPLNKRPTADYSWPPPGHELAYLVTSPNDSVDLQRDFPYIYMIGAHDLIEQVQYLAALGDGVR
jgi:hypothetical protein